MLLYDVEDLLVGIPLVCPYVYDHPALVRHDIMLCPRVYHGQRHLRRPQQLRYLLEFVVPYPLYIVESLVYGVHAVVSRGMA